MREILFRGKREYTNEWIYGDLLTSTDIVNCTEIAENTGMGDRYDVIPETVGQYTGLTDMNYTKIFEGDILQRNNNPKDIVKTVFGKFSVIDAETETAVDEVTGWHCEVIPTDAISEVLPFCLPMPLTDYYINRCNAEVIGNVHDNPELLGGE